MVEGVSYDRSALPTPEAVAAMFRSATLISSDLDKTLIEPDPRDLAARVIGSILTARGFPISAQDVVAAGSMVPRESLHPARDLLLGERYGSLIRGLVERAYPGIAPERTLDLTDEWVSSEPDLSRMGAAQVELGFSRETQPFYELISAYGTHLRRPSTQYMRALPGAEAFLAYGTARVADGTLPGGFILLTNSRKDRAVRHMSLIPAQGAAFTHIVSATDGIVSRFNPETGIYDDVYQALRPHRVKPDPQAHRIMLAATNTAAEHAIYLGDAVYDVEATLAAGIAACVLINKAAILPPELADDPRVMQFPNLSDLMHILATTL